MTSYQLPGINLKINAKPARIEKALNNIFKACLVTHKPYDIVINGRGVTSARFYHYLPAWILSQLKNIKIDIKPVMIYGQDRQAAAIGLCHQEMYIAWYSDDIKCIEFLCTTDDFDSNYGLFHPVVIPILREIFLLHGQLMLHSASVVCPSNIGILIVAVSGEGKTTTALSMIREGANLLADDLIVVNQQHEGVQAMGIPKWLNLTDDTINFFDELKAQPNSSFSHQHKNKKSIAAEKIYGQDCYQLEADIKLIYFVKLGGDRPQVKKLSVSDSINRLSLAHGFSLNQHLGSHSMEIILGVLSHSHVYELTTGSDPEKLGEWLIQRSREHACLA